MFAKSNTSPPQVTITNQKRLLWCFLLAAGALVRLWFCFQQPAGSGDIIKHMLTGQMVLDHGIKSMSQPASTVYPEFSHLVPWGEVPYNYPPLATLFWTCCAWLGCSLFSVKLILTGIELLNTLLVQKLTDSKLWAFVYWSFPCSVYWVSNDAQFEPLQTLGILVALLCIQSRPGLAGAALAAGIQVKLLAVLFAPYLCYRAWKDGGLRHLLVLFLGITLGMLPGLYYALHYNVIGQVLVTASWQNTFNPYHWAFWHHNRWWVPGKWQLVIQLSGYALGALALRLAWGSSAKLSSSIALFGLLAASRILGVFQWWYFTLLIPCLIPLQIEARKSQRLLCAMICLCFFVEPVSWMKMLKPNWGPTGQGWEYDIHKPIKVALALAAQSKERSITPPEPTKQFHIP